MASKRVIFGAMAAMVIATVVMAQQLPINAINQNGIQVGNVRYPTFAASAIGIVPASSATDIFCIAASASKNIYITNVSFSGTAGTAVTAHMAILRRASVDTGGTAGTGLAAPVAMGESALSGTATASLVSYTANPTINDSNPGYARAAVLGIPTSSAALAQTISWAFGTSAGQFNTELVLVKGTTQQVCLNLEGTTISSGYIDVWIEWQEY